LSVDQTRRTLNQLDNEIAALEKKLAELAKKEADKSKRINDTQKSITKNTSASTLQSKVRQIQGWQNDLVKVSSDKADVNKKIADKRKKRADTTVKLQKEEADELKKADKAQKAIHDNYERRIADLSSLLKQQVAQAKPPHNLYEKSGNEEYDVFISHASEDKESFADELYNELKVAGIKVWYDALSIVWGDSLRAKIDDGLKKSKFGIVVISKDYIRKGWTQYELDALFQIEMTNGKTILPVWHNITKDEVQAFSPTLAGRKAMSTAMFTIKEITDELIKLLGKSDVIEQDTETEDKANG